MSKHLQLGLLAALLLVNVCNTLRAEESTQFDWTSLPAKPNANKHASVLATFQLPNTDISTLNPNIDLGDNAQAVKSGYPNRHIPGIGSAIVAIPNKPGEFYMLTDRGPNFDHTNWLGSVNGKTFPLPKFTPAIVHVKLTQGEGAIGRIEVIRAIPIVDSKGQPVTGLSNHEVDEQAFSGKSNTPLSFHPAGLDTEALQLLPDGNFLVSEEYGPSIAVIDRSGHVLMRYVPIGKTYDGVNYPIKEILPSIYKERRGNHGFENVSVTPDGKTAYATLQSPMGNENKKAYKKSRLVRILRLDITKPTDAIVTGMFVVLQSDKSAYPKTDKQKDLKYSDAVAISQDKLLLLERATNKVKLIEADLSAATNILTHIDMNTLLFEKEGEKLGKLTITPASTREVFDSHDVRSKIDTDKLEGLAVLSPNVVVLSNDNDFGVGENTNNYPSKAWVVRLGKSLSMH
jgi:hypothetical protein